MLEVPNMGSLFKKQAGVVCLVDGKVVLVSGDNGKTWRVPLGPPGDDPDELKKQAEDVAWQEAGVLGFAASKRLGGYSYTAGGKMFQVSVFTLEARKYRDSWPQSENMERLLLPASEAADRVDEYGVGEILRKLARQ